MITVSPSARTVSKNRHSDMAKQFLTTVPKKREFQEMLDQLNIYIKNPMNLYLTGHVKISSQMATDPYLRAKMTAFPEKKNKIK